MTATAAAAAVTATATATTKTTTMTSAAETGSAGAAFGGADVSGTTVVSEERLGELRGMGFSEEDARQALQKHENKLQEAINWLLSDRP